MVIDPARVDQHWVGVEKFMALKKMSLSAIFFKELTLSICSSSLLMGRTMSWKTCLVKVMALTAGVVVNFMKAGLGGSIQPRRKRKRGWFPNGIIDSRTQKIACGGSRKRKS